MKLSLKATLTQLNQLWLQVPKCWKDGQWAWLLQRPFDSCCASSFIMITLREEVIRGPFFRGAHRISSARATSDNVTSTADEKASNFFVWCWRRGALKDGKYLLLFWSETIKSTSTSGDILRSCVARGEKGGKSFKLHTQPTIWLRRAKKSKWKFHLFSAVFAPTHSPGPTDPKYQRNIHSITPVFIHFSTRLSVYGQKSWMPSIQTTGKSKKIAGSDPTRRLLCRGVLRWLHFFCSCISCP